MSVVTLKTTDMMLGDSPAPDGKVDTAAGRLPAIATAANEPLAGETNAATATAVPDKPLYVRTRAPEWLVRVFAMACGLAVFIAIWAALAKGGRLPAPGSTWMSAMEVFGDPFYRKGPNDQGIGWNILASLGRVGIGFGMAALIGIP